MRETYVDNEKVFVLVNHQNMYFVDRGDDGLMLSKTLLDSNGCLDLYTEGNRERLENMIIEYDDLSKFNIQEINIKTTTEVNPGPLYNMNINKEGYYVCEEKQATDV